MSFDDQSICRLCFATEGSNSEEVFSSIKKYLPFLESLTVISQDESMPQKICPNCEYHIENTQLLRKRIHFTETLWAKYKKQQQETVSDLFLNCHLCGQNFDCPGLIAHITSEHGEVHSLKCEFCQVLFESLDIPIKVEAEPVMEIESVFINPDDEQSDGEQCSESEDSNSSSDSEPTPTAFSSVLPEQPSCSKERQECEVEETTDHDFDYKDTHIAAFANLRGIKVNYYSCPLCNKLVARMDGLKRHMKLVHSKDTQQKPKQIQQLPVALQDDGNSDDISKDDENSTMSNEPMSKGNGHPLDCLICGLNLARKDSLRRHLRRMHNIETDVKRSTDAETSTLTPLAENELGMDQVQRVTKLSKEGVKTTFYNCPLPLCDLSTARLGSFKRHLGRIHQMTLRRHYKRDYDLSQLLLTQSIISSLPSTSAAPLPKSTVQDKKRKAPPSTSKARPPKSTAPPPDTSLKDKNNLFKCKVCCVHLHRRDAFRRHMALHNDPQCTRCLSVFATEEERLAHDDEYDKYFELHGCDRYPCEWCPKRFNSYCEQQNHRFIHIEHKCRLCEQVFRTSGELEKHGDEVHPGTVYKCNKCEVDFQTRSERRKHCLKVHNTVLCGICGLWIMGHFKQHMRKHKGIKPFKCRYDGCGKAFLSREMLKLHSAVHSENRPFACDFEGCTKRFRHSRTLTSHRITHSDEKRYKCHFENCDRAFHGTFDLNLHMRRHTGDKPFTCEGCGEGFFTMSLQRKHVRSCNAIVEQPADMEENIEEYMEGEIKDTLVV